MFTRKKVRRPGRRKGAASIMETPAASWRLIIQKLATSHTWVHGTPSSHASRSKMAKVRGMLKKEFPSKTHAADEIEGAASFLIN